MTWSSRLSPTLLQPMCSPPPWIFIPCLRIWRTSRLSAPASFSSIFLFTGHTYYAWLRRQKVTTSPDRRASLSPPTALDSGSVRSNLTSSPQLQHANPSLSVRCGCCGLYARMQAWLLHVAGGVVVSNSCGKISAKSNNTLSIYTSHFEVL